LRGDSLRGQISSEVVEGIGLGCTVGAATGNSGLAFLTMLVAPIVSHPFVTLGYNYTHQVDPVTGSKHLGDLRQAVLNLEATVQRVAPDARPAFALSNEELQLAIDRAVVQSGALLAEIEEGIAVEHARTPGELDRIVDRALELRANGAPYENAAVAHVKLAQVLSRLLEKEIPSFQSALDSAPRSLSDKDKALFAEIYRRVSLYLPQVIAAQGALTNIQESTDLGGLPAIAKNAREKLTSQREDLVNLLGKSQLLAQGVAPVEEWR
jgi:hypothetical protein